MVYCVALYIMGPIHYYKSCVCMLYVLNIELIITHLFDFRVKAESTFWTIIGQKYVKKTKVEQILNYHFFSSVM